MYLRQNGTSVKLVEETQVDHITDHHLPFVDKLYDMADALLKRMGIAGDYAIVNATIHGRKTDELRTTDELLMVQ
jgi:hypothetical protein